MKRFISLMLLLFLMVPCLNAQKKEIAQARTYIKSGKNLDKAEQAMRKLLKDSANRENLKIHAVLCEVMRKQYEETNMKLYLKQKVDSSAMFTLLRNFFLDCETLDSLDSKPDKKGRIAPRFRQRHASFLSVYRKNLFGGGAYHIRKQKYQEAYNLLDTYLSCVNQPLFSGTKIEEDSVAAYWSLYCGYKLQIPEITLKYASLALRDTSHLEYALEYLAETYKTLKDSVSYEQTLKDGFRHYSKSPYFFTYLMDYYNETKKSTKALDVVNSALENDSENELFLFAKSNLMLNLGHYDECIQLCDRIIARNDSMAESFYNAGVAYINKAFLLENNVRIDSKTKAAIKKNYQLSMPYIERYRALKPDEKDKWGAALYNIYLRLNMGKKFEEIDRLLR